MARTDSDGNPVDDADQAGTVTSATLRLPGGCRAGCRRGPTFADAGGLSYLGDGYWQSNWKSSKHWTGCRALTLMLSGGSTLTADFQFK